MIISNISVEAFFITSLDNETQECSFEYIKEFSKPIFWIVFEDFFLYNYYPMFGLAQLLGSDID